MSTENSATQSILDRPDLDTLLGEFVDLIRILRPLAERALAAEHLWEPSVRSSGVKSTQEAEAIALASKLDSMGERPTLSRLSKEMGVPRSTMQRWQHLSAALDQIVGRQRSVRRGYVNRSDAGVVVDGLEE